MKHARNPIIKNNIFKTISILTTLSLILQVVSPVFLYANNGPIQQDALGGNAESNLVNSFTGEFNYSVPLITVPDPSGEGFPVSMSYSSSTSPESDASWVGYGWTLNPGSIVRNKRGTADDLNGEDVIFYNRTQKNITVTAAVDASMEILDANLSVSTNRSVIYNNQNGWSVATGIGVSYMGFAGLNLNVKEGEASVTPSFNPFALVTNELFGGGIDASTGKKNHYYENKLLSDQTSQMGMSYTFAPNSPKQTSSYAYEGTSYSIKASAQGNFLHLGPSAGVSGTYQETSTNDKQKKAFGYLYLSNSTKDDLTDYSTEKSKNLDEDKRYFLSPSFTTPDYFSMTGNVAGGSFKAHQLTVGEVHPNSENSHIDIVQGGVQYMTPPPAPPTAVGNWGVSARVNVGDHDIHIGGLHDYPNYSYRSEAQSMIQGRNVVFRMMNDIGGKVEYDNNDDPIVADNNSMRVALNECYKEANQSGMVASSTSIEFKTYQQLRSEQTSFHRNFSNHNNNYRKGASLEDIKVMPTSIAQFAVTQPNGKKLVYGMPVYSKDETNLTYGLYDYVRDEVRPIVKNTNSNQVFAIGNNIGDDNGLNDFTRSNNTVSKSGEFRSTPVANTFLITEMRSSDYIDRTNDGPTKDDFGSYVLFKYDKSPDAPSPTPRFAKWRAPYTGYTYSKGRHSDYKDDVVSYQEGKSEVVYLSKVETKTHIAYFINNKSTKEELQFPANVNWGNIGSTDNRLDTYPAPQEKDASSIQFPLHNGDNPYKYLKQIQLWTKNPDTGLPEKLLQKVHFVYDYSLMPNHPASAVVNGQRLGKLTLKKIWFENEGVVNAKIAPYQFSYQTPLRSLLPAYVPTVYRNYFPTSALVENPEYNLVNIDRWGSYRNDGGIKNQNYETWINQKEDATLDPSAWKLKVISLPSGGQIHIQYEQNQYSYVQNKRAYVMAQIDSRENDTYYLKCDELDGTSIATTENYLDLVKIIQERFITRKEPMYYRFYYNFNTAHLTDEAYSEFINGYSLISECGYDNTKGKIWIKFANNFVPTESAEKFLKTYRKLMHKDKEHEPDLASDVAEMITDVWKYASSGLLDNWLVNATTPKNLREQRSYVRIPVLMKKKGGGVRVKRLLVYNPEHALESSRDAAFYGSEYVYELFDGKRMISSGVATNEPGLGREENSIVGVLPDVTIDKIVNQEDIVQYEGPIGESLLPGASVGYSRVIVKNINPYVSNTGYSVYDYFTTKEYPSVETKRSSMGFYNSESSPTVTALFQNSDQEIRATQGYSFILNSMNGKLSSIKRFPGLYETSNNNGTTIEPLQGNPLYEQRVNYYNSNQPVALFVEKDRPFVYDTPGKEVEITMEGRTVRVSNSDLPIEASFTLMAPLPWVWASMMPYSFEKIEEVKLHVTTKVVSYPVFLKSITTITDGISSTQENLAFSPYTGEPLVTRTFDGYDKVDLSGNSNTLNGEKVTYKTPAPQQYYSMGQVSESNGVVFLEKKPTQAPDRHFGKINLTTYTLNNIHKLKISVLPANEGITLSDYAKNDIRGRVSKILRTISSGDIVTLQKRKDITGSFTKISSELYDKEVFGGGDVDEEKLCCVTIGEIYCANLDNGEIDCTLLQNKFTQNYSTLNNVSDPDLFTILYSGKSNQLETDIGNTILYGNSNIESRLVYAKSIYDKQQQINLWNQSFLQYENQMYSDEIAEPSQSLEWGRLSVSRSYIWNNPNNNIPFDPISYFQIPHVNWSNQTNLDKYSYDMLVKYPRWHRQVIDQNGNWIKKFGVLKTVMWDGNTSSLMSYNNNGNTITIQPQYLDFCGTERFYVNDDGDVTFGTCNSNVSQARTFALRYRGIVCRDYIDNANPCQGCVDPSDETAKRYKDVPLNPTIYVPNCLSTKLTAYPTATEFNTIKVLSANAVNFKDSWNFIGTGFTLGNGVNEYEVGTKGVWRVASSYVYRDAASGSEVVSTDRSYSSGVVSNFKQFDWQSATQDDKWIYVSNIIQYSPNGNVLEQLDVLNDMPTSVRYDYSVGFGGLVPSIVTKNSERTSIFFESFENSAPTSAISTNAHSGRRSIQIGNTPVTIQTNVYTSDRLRSVQKSDGLQIRYWQKMYTSSLYLLLTGVTGTIPAPTIISQSGDWSLCEVIIPASQISTTNSAPIDITFNLGFSIHPYTWIDDVRIQPVFSSSVCTVYQPGTYRKIATFDDQHFGLYFQYNSEGTLVRTVKETIKGSMTIQDVHQHIPMIARNSSYSTGGAYTIPISMVHTDHGTPGALYFGKQQMLNGSVGNEVPKQSTSTYDLLNINITPDSKTIKVLGNDTTGVDIKDILKSIKPDTTLIDKQLQQIKTQSKQIIDSADVKRSINSVKAKAKEVKQSIHKDTLSIKNKY